MKFTFPIFAFLMFLVSACGPSTLNESQIQTAIAETQKAASTDTPIPVVASNTPANTLAPASSATPKPTSTPSSTATPSAPQFGTRQNPFFIGEFAQLTMGDKIAFEIGITKVLRGSEALSFIRSYNSANDEAPSGLEHVVAQVTVRYTGPDKGLLELDTDYWGMVTKGQVFRYQDKPVFTCCISTEFDNIALFAGGEATGYVVFQAYNDDPNPLLAFGLSSDGKKGWFFALQARDPNDPNAPQPVPVEANPTPDPEQCDKGSLYNPYPIGEFAQLVMDGKVSLEIQVVKVLRGNQAFSFIRSYNSANDPAPEGMEHIVAEVLVRYVGKDEGLLQLNQDFWSMVTKGQIYRYNNKPAFTCCIGSEFDVSVFAGGEASGHLVFQVYEDDLNPLLAFSLSSDGKEGWFFSLSEAEGP